MKKKLTDLINKEETKNNIIKPFPLSNSKLTSKIYKIITDGIKYDQTKFGNNAIIKLIKKNKVDLLIIAADVEPLETIGHFVYLCEANDIPYIFTPSKACLGRACNISRPTIAVAILKAEDSYLASHVDDVKLYIFEQQIIN